MKYVIVQMHGLDFDFAITFPEAIQHSAAIDRRQLRPIAAGFYKEKADGSIMTWGESTSLGLKSRPALDAMTIHFSKSIPSVNEESEEGAGKDTNFTNYHE
jgi:hypothetical protein